jgi:chromosome partitioning protein
LDALQGLSGWDVVLFDAPPSLSPVVAQMGQHCDRILIPTLCEPAALKGVSEAVGLIRNERPEVPIDVLRVRYRTRLVLSRDATDMLIAGSEDFGYRLLHTTIPDNIAVAEAIASQQSVLDYAKASTGAKAYGSLGKEVSKIWKL